jgi:hypothetical protein
MNAPWTPDPCTDPAKWAGETVCRRPYDVGAYGRGPYGRCAIIGGSIWGTEAACAPFTAQAPLTASPWRRGRG